MSFAMLNAAWPLQMPPAKKAVLIALADRAGDDGTCRPSIADIRRRTCLGERTVQDALQYLEESGALKRTFRRGHSTMFEITPNTFLPPQMTHPRSTRTPAADAGEGRSSRTPTPAGAAPTPAGAAPRTIKNHQLNHQRTISARDACIDLADGFAEFWQAYPRKVSKPHAEKAWRKLRLGMQALPDILAGIERDRQSAQWQRDDGKFIPHPATWLNGRRWEDEAAHKVARPDGELPNGNVIVDGVEYDQSVGWAMLAAKQQRAAA